jgi:uncharacterized protein with HEPN domain
MRKDDLIRIRHMLDIAREAMSFARNRTLSDLDTDRMLTLAIAR